MAQQGSLEATKDPVAEALLSSANPARLAYTGMDGSPRVVPIWFRWTGDQFVLAEGPKLKALTADPRVALTTDGNAWPHRVMLVRGRSSIELLDDVGPSIACGDAIFRARTGPSLGKHAPREVHGPYRHHIKLVGIPDFKTRFPSALAL
jgi:Pyridoxamine 5'-phosphate oxidase